MVGILKANRNRLLLCLCCLMSSDALRLVFCFTLVLIYRKKLLVVIKRFLLRNLIFNYEHLNQMSHGFFQLYSIALRKGKRCSFHMYQEFVCVQVTQRDFPLHPSFLICEVMKYLNNWYLAEALIPTVILAKTKEESSKYQAGVLCL